MPPACPFSLILFRGCVPCLQSFVLPSQSLTWHGLHIRAFGCDWRVSMEIESRNNGRSWKIVFKSGSFRAEEPHQWHQLNSRDWLSLQTSLRDLQQGCGLKGWKVWSSSSHNETWSIPSFEGKHQGSWAEKQETGALMTPAAITTLTYMALDLFYMRE